MRVDVGGRRIYFDVEGPGLVPDGPTMVERPTVVLLHGGPGMDHSGYKPAFSRLADIAQLVYVDHSGQGRSEPTSPDRWTLDTWADDIVGLCDALEIERPVIHGWSFGGMVAMNLAARHPDRLAKLILQSTAARMDVDRIAAAFQALGGEEPAGIARAYWADPSPESMQLYMEVCLPLYSPEPLDIDSMARMVMTPALLEGGWTEALTFDLTAGLADITVPALVLSGLLDPITPPGAATEIVEHLPPDLSTHESFDRSGHFIHDTEPERFFEALLEFIGS
jgi:pimeloyl-ACP methyl ester carboxylesterase